MSCRWPVASKELTFPSFPAWVQRCRSLPEFQHQILVMLEDSHDDATVFSPVTPVTINSSPRTFPFTHQEESATLASTVLVGSIVESMLSLDTTRISLGPIDSHLVRAIAIRLLALPVDTLNCRSRQHVTGMPDTIRPVSVPTEEVLILPEVVKLEVGEPTTEGHKLLHSVDKERHIDTHSRSCWTVNL